MFHDQHVLTNGMYLPFCSFLCPAQSLLWVYPVWVHSQYGLEIFQLFRCTNLALNRFFPTFLSGRHVLIQGVSGCPHSCTPPVFIHPLYVCTPQGFRHPHMSHMLLCASVCSQKLLHVVGGCWGSLHG